MGAPSMARREDGARAKAVPPTLVAPFIHRPHLERRLDDAHQRRLTLVIADAGFGKSTLLASWAAGRGVAWYTVTTADAEVGVFAAGVVDALGVRVPEVAEAIRGLVAAGRGPDADADEPIRATAHAALVADALDAHLAEDLVLIVDDLSEIAPDDPAARFIEALVRMAPSRLHVVLASRVPPPFPVERLRGRGQATGLGGAELAFDPDDTRSLLRQLLDTDDAALVSALHDATGGWPAAVRLAAEALRTVPPPQRLARLDRILRPGGPVAAYLAEEAITRSPPGVRDLLTVVSPLDRFSPELCAGLGIPDADRLLPDLASRGLFVQALGDGTGYGLLPLVRDVVRADTRVGGRDDRFTLRRAATWHMRHGSASDALACLRAGHDARLPAFLAERGGELLAAGDVDAVLAAAADVPPARRGALIDRLEGEARQVRGDWDEALRCFARVASPDGPLPAAVAWRTGLIHHLRGELGPALESYGRGSADGSDLANEALLHAWWASALWLRGDIDGCRTLAERSLDEATGADDDHALAAAHTVLAMLAAVDSDRRGNDAHYLRALTHATRANDVLQTIRIRANRGSRAVEEGYYAEALQELDEAIRLADLAGFAAFRALALSNRGEALLSMGRLDEAISELEAARSVYQRMESRLVAYPLGHLGEVYRERGDMALARANFEEAIAVAMAAGDQQALVPSLSGLARVLVRTEPERAAELANRAVAAGPVLGRTAALLAVGWVALARVDASTARRSGREAEALARQRRDRAGLAAAIELQVRSADDPVGELDRLDEALALWRDLGNPMGVARVELARAELLPAARAIPVAERALAESRRIGARRMAGNANRLLNLLTTPADREVEVRTLGGFEVLRDHRPVSLTEWRSRKARDVLKLLVAARGTRVVREQLLDRFWPEDDIARSSPRLSVALSTIRAVLDPDKRHGPDRYIGADRACAWVNVDHLPIDVEVFLAEAAEGLRGLEAGEPDARLALSSAESRYRGDFLGEDVYEDWAVATREEARAAYQRIASALADLAISSGEPIVAAGYLRRMIERDPWDEGAHLRLVATLASAGQHGEARRAYRSYTHRMQELSLEAAPFP
jgi:ATP/maltotriose-dependent transcriptional regulator MalT/DNA-binding SARP family transcriptional activator